jgi:integral membrane protein (TIGR01906 family)
VTLAWDRFFVVFHKIFFRNDYWIFDEASDPIIKVLPDEFFFHEAIFMLAIVLAIGAVLLISGHFLCRKNG